MFGKMDELLFKSECACFSASCFIVSVKRPETKIKI